MQFTTDGLSRDSPASTRVRAIDHTEARSNGFRFAVTSSHAPTSPKRDTVSILLLIAAIVTPLSGVASLALILQFLRHVYDRTQLGSLNAGRSVGHRHTACIVERVSPLPAIEVSAAEPDPSLSEEPGKVPLGCNRGDPGPRRNGSDVLNRALQYQGPASSPSIYPDGARKRIVYVLTIIDRWLTAQSRTSNRT
jgi:hypothetical protein